MEQFIRDGEQQGAKLCQDFHDQFPNAPAKLIRYHDRSLTFYRWRQSGARQWGGRSTTAINLTGEAGLKLLARIPASARRHYVNYERRRLYLNVQLSTATYELNRLQDWLDGLETLRAIDEHGIAAVLADTLAAN